MESDANDEFISIFHQLVNKSARFSQTQKPEVEVIYNPDDNNFWMLSMILLGCAFLLFVMGSVYLLCSSGQAGADGDKVRRRQKAEDF